LQPGGFWLAADFVQTPGTGIFQIRNRILLKTMYLFFRVVSRIQAVSLPDWQNILAAYSLVPQKTAYFYHDMIKSIIYQKM
jgi:hypothetical protein